MILRPLSAALAAAVLAGPAAAAPRQHGNMIYDPPPGWTVGRSEGGVQVLLYDGPEERCAYCSILLGPGAPAQGDLAGWLAAQAPLLLDEEDRESLRIVQPSGAGSPGRRPIALMSAWVGNDLFFAFALQAGDRYEVMAFKGYGYDEEEIARTSAFLQSDETRFLDEIRYVSEGAAPLMPPPAPGSLSGLWWGWTTSYGLNLDMTMRMDVDHRTLAFWPEGYFYDGTPPGGLARPDTAALRAAWDEGWGTYREQGGQVVLTYVTGETETLTPSGDGWTDRDGRALGPVEPLPDGFLLSGGISSFHYSGFTPGSGIEGGVSSSSSTTFLPDGTYTGESFGGAFGNLTDGAGTTTGGFATSGPGDAQGGRYKVRDGLAILRPADGGPERRLLAYRLPDGGIMLDDQLLESD